MRPLLILLILATTVQAGELAELEQRALGRYLDALAVGAGRDAVTEDKLADMGFAGLRLTMEAYAASDPELPAPARRAFEALLDRQSRAALAPWPVIVFYSPEMAAFVSDPADDPLPARLFARLLAGEPTRLSYDLAVRLTPTLALAALDAPEPNAGLLDAWNRRLHRGSETRPIPDVEARLGRIGARFSPELPPDQLEPLLRFLSHWPILRQSYEAAQAQALSTTDRDRLLAALTVQAEAPVHLERNPAIVKACLADPAIVRAAFRGYLADVTGDHAAVLRELWLLLPPEQVRLRHACLQAMIAHPRGNADLALAAVRDDPLEYMDVAIAVLAHGAALANEAVTLVLQRRRAGLEEALRLATDLDLKGHDAAALDILRTVDDQIVRQAALRYLQRADVAIRQQLLPWLRHANPDLRLSAIQLFRTIDGADEAALDAIGPAIGWVALNDPSMGHRQEALFCLATWRQPDAVALCRHILGLYPTVVGEDGLTVSETNYSEYRLRLVALVGLAIDGDAAAERELLAIHHLGGPVERMDVLLAFIEIGRVPEAAFEDLEQAGEMKLTATAVELIARHGSEAQRLRMRSYLQASPWWRLFAEAGLDDHQILERAGVGHE